jgi:hypothetical protein
MPPSFSKDGLNGIVEYLAGPSTSTWGSVRASQGNFPLKYHHLLLLE